jgi:hypothetical protein
VDVWVFIDGQKMEVTGRVPGALGESALDDGIHPGKSFLSGRLITSDRFQISGIPENKCNNLFETTILAETLNFHIAEIQSFSQNHSFGPTDIHISRNA